MKFGIGQKVRVKYFKELADKYGITDKGIAIGTYFFEREMKVYCGEEYYISHFVDGLYVLDTEDNQDWVFAPETLELPNEKKTDEEKLDDVAEALTDISGASAVAQVVKSQPAKRPYTRKS